MSVQHPNASHVHGGDTERGQITGARFGGCPNLPFPDTLPGPPTVGTSMCGRRWGVSSCSALG